MANPSTWHPNGQASNRSPILPISIPKLGRLIHNLIKCRVYVIGKLYLGHRPHALCRQSNREAQDTLLSKRSIEHAVAAKVLREIHRAPEDAAKGDILAEDEYRVI